MINFHIPDFAVHFKLNLLLLKMMREAPERFREDIKIASVYGDFPPSVWNGGRVQLMHSEERFIRGVTKTFNDFGVPIRFTFTNPLLTEEHLDDPHCNFCMQTADNGLNEVTVVSPILERYIREKYPKYKLISSTCKQINDFEGLNAELEKDYKLVVLSYNLNNKFEYLGKIKRKDKCEFLLNATCVPDCQLCTEHRRCIGQTEINYWKHLRTGVPFEPLEFRCDYGDNYTLFDSMEFPTFIKAEDVYGRYTDMGFSNFKIEGRTGPTFTVLENYLYYLVKPEFCNETRLEFYKQLVKNGVVKINI